MRLPTRPYILVTVHYNHTSENNSSPEKYTAEVCGKDKEIVIHAGTLDGNEVNRMALDWAENLGLPLYMRTKITKEIYEEGELILVQPGDFIP